MTTMHTVPSGTLHSRSYLTGTPIKHSTHTCGRQLKAAKPCAIAAPERLETLDRTEEAELQQKDAFAELVALSKQSVNRPQKVGIRERLRFKK